MATLSEEAINAMIAQQLAQQLAPLKAEIDLLKTENAALRAERANQNEDPVTHHQPIFDSDSDDFASNWLLCQISRTESKDALGLCVSQRVF
mmetsp:Transcript_66218/g.163071  ORF Transcript_66218/g.163071 Transcript_66218/m.163071 type:complete len:92 (-) Transcript_66218:240-515(-)